MSTGPPYIDESYVSRPFNLSFTTGRELVFNVWGSDDEVAVANLLIATAPAAYLGLLRDSIDAEPLGNGVWRGTVKYVTLETTNDYTFSTGGGTSKITQSLGTTIYSPPGATAPDFAGAIGVSEDNVEGVDIVVPHYEFSETHQFEDTFVSDAYKRYLADLTGSINAATFRNWDPGEVLLMGVNGSKKGFISSTGDIGWTLTFNFAVEPNATGLTVGPITGISKRGWDYLWVAYSDAEDLTAYHLVKRPTGAYVEVVYPDGDYTLLGI